MKVKYFIAVLLIPGCIWAQSSKNSKEVEQIVITKKGPAAEKLTIVVDGEKVTVNGDPLDKNEKNADITVTRRKIKDLDVLIDADAPGQRRVIRRYNVGPQVQAMPLQPNKAILGVVTQKNDRGVEVLNITKQSAAELAGLKEGDIITEIDRNKVTTPDELSKAIKDKTPGDKVTIAYLRNNKQYTAVAELKKWEVPEIPAFGSIDGHTIPGFNIEEFRSSLGDFENQPGMRQFRTFGQPVNRAKLGIKIQDVETGSGVKVLEVEEGSDAAKAGLKAGDIIKQVDGFNITGADDMRLKATLAKPGDNLNVELNRNGKTQNVNIQLSKKIKTADL